MLAEDTNRMLLSPARSPRTFDQLHSELRNIKVENAMLGLPELQGQPQRARELAVQEARQVLEAGIEERFWREVVAPLKVDIAEALTPSLVELPLEQFARRWTAQRAAVESACLAAACRWTVLSEQALWQLLQRPSVPNGTVEQTTLLTSPPFVLMRFEAFVEAVGAEQRAATGEQVAAAMADAREHARLLFQGLLPEVKPRTAAGEDGRVTVSVDASGERLAEAVAFAFVCAYWQHGEMTERLNRAAQACIDAEWEEACLQARQKLAQRRANLLRAFEGLERTPKSAPVELGAQVAFLCEGMRETLNDEDAQLRGCEGILELLPSRSIEEWRAADSEQQQELRDVYGTFADSGAVDAILSAMENHPTSDSAQASACEVFAVLARNHSTVSVRSAAALVAAMSTSQTAAVQENGCRALMNLAVNADNKVKIAGVGGIEAVVEAMTRHSDSAAVQQNGCGALWNLAVNADNKVKIVGVGGIEAVVEAMTRHSDSAAVQQNGCGALWDLALNADNKVKIVGVGGIEAVLEAMTRHSDSAAVQQNGCGALGNLAVNADNKVKIVGVGGIEAVVEAMTRHSDSAAVQQTGCGALWNLAVNADNKVKIVGVGGIEAVLEAMRHHPKSAAVQQNGCGALGRLAINNTDHAVNIAEAGAVEAVLEAMRHHPGAAALQQNARCALLCLKDPAAITNPKVRSDGALAVPIKMLRWSRARVGVVTGSVGKLFRRITSNTEGTRVGYNESCTPGTRALLLP